MTQPRPRQTPTIYDVADQAGCSPRTVSRYFNAPEKLAQRTRDRIASIVDELEFRPNVFANRVSRQDLGIIGVLVCAESDRAFLHAYRDMLSVASMELARRGRDLLLITVDGTNEERVIHESFRQRKMDGLVVMGRPGPLLSAELASGRTPFVSLTDWPSADLPGGRRVIVDEQAAYRELTAALLARGYRRPAYVQAREPDLRKPVHLAGARAAIAAADPVAPLVILQGDATLAGAHASLDAWERLDPRPDLLLAQGDVLGVCLLQAARDRGIDVPGQLGVAGFYGMEMIDYITPRLSTVRIPFEAMATVAVDLLVDRPTETDDRYLPARLELADSTR